MASVREVKARIKSVRNIQQITKAMKMVAAARIKRAESRLKAARPYTQKLREVLEDLVAAISDVSHPLLAPRTVKRIGIVVVSSDKGLCGSFNSNLLKKAQTFLQSPPNGAQVDVMVFGSKALRFMQRRKYNVKESFTNFKAVFQEAQAGANMATDWYLSGQVDEVYVLYTEMISAALQAPKLARVLPLSPDEAGKEKKKKRSPVAYTFEPSPEKALDVIIPRYLEAMFFLMLLESRAAELSARLRAMSNATDNADKLASALTLQYFRARQDQITGELIEISSGAAALKK